MNVKALLFVLVVYAIVGVFTLPTVNYPRPPQLDGGVFDVFKIVSYMFNVLMFMVSVVGKIITLDVLPFPLNVIFSIVLLGLLIFSIFDVLIGIGRIIAEALPFCVLFLLMLQLCNISMVYAQETVTETTTVTETIYIQNPLEFKFETMVFLIAIILFIISAMLRKALINGVLGVITIMLAFYFYGDLTFLMIILGIIDIIMGLWGK